MSIDPQVATGVLVPPTESGVAMAHEWTEQEARETPVADDYCVWCKLPVRGNNARPVGDDEMLCTNCLGDLRQFKRYQRVMIVASEGFDVAAKTIAETCDAFHEQLVAYYGDDPAMFRVPDRVSRAGERFELGTANPQSGADGERTADTTPESDTDTEDDT